MISTHGEERFRVVTTNLMFGLWNEIFGNIEMTGALVDRLAQRAHIISMVGRVAVNMKITAEVDDNFISIK